MAAYKRTKPSDIAKNRADILKDMEDRTNVPQSEREFPNIIEQGRRMFARVMAKKRAKKYPPPSVEGAAVTGRTNNNTI